MKKPINEIKRMQRIAGLITESEYQESLISENFKVGDKAKINKNVTRFDNEAHDFFVGDIGTIVAIDKEKQRAQFKKKNGSTFSIALKALDLLESEYQESLMNEASSDEVPLSDRVKKFIDKAVASAKKDGEFENLMDAEWFDNELIDELIDLFPNKDYDRASKEVMDYISQVTK